MSTYLHLKKAEKNKFDFFGIENPDYELNELMGFAMGIDCRDITFLDMLSCEADEKIADRFHELCSRRVNGEPLQYILGQWEFYGIPIKVGEGVLIPRQDTETIVETAEGKLSELRNLTVIDLCSGSGCIALALEKTLDCKEIYCVEKYEQAYEYLEKNIDINKSKAQAVLADVLDEKTADKLPYADLIVCNPPYITDSEMKTLQKEVTFEPFTALCGGEDGLEYYCTISRIWKKKLKENGMLLFEIGKDMEDEVMQILIQLGYGNVRTRPDLSRINRCVFGFNNTRVKKCTDVMRV